ncbi:IS3 family transposase [Blastopirellula sp. J2-11]|nr:IS3 family transposase [Blastopirellula sp. J2-11]
MQFAWIAQHRDSFPVETMCCVLQVSKSGFYRSLRAQPGPRALRTAKIHQAVKHVFEQSDQIYGSEKIAKKLQASDEMESPCRNTVAKAMRDLGLKSKVFSRFNPTTTKADPTKRPAANLLDQQFAADAPNQKWVTDITYLPTASGWVYLAVVLDLFSRKVVGWELSTSLATSLVNSALRNAIESRRPNTKQLLHHSDRGCQYTSDEYQRTLKTLGITCSMSRTGCCYDNAVMERFFWSLKHERTKFEEFANIEEARLSVFRYIETFYNSERIHQTLGYLTPNQFEARHATSLAA